MKILHVVHGLARGGLENGVINLLNHLPREEFEQAVCCLDKRGEMADRILRDIPIQVLDRGRHDLTVPLRLARLIRDWRPDLIHCRNWNTWLDAFLGHWLAGGGATLVWSFHGFADGHWFPPRRRRASRWLAKGTDALFAVCRDSAQRYALAASIPPERFGVVYNGVDCERFRPSPNRAALRESLGIAPDELLVLAVGSLTPVKDHASLISATAGVCRQVTRPLRFMILGEGALRGELESQIKQQGLEERVFLPGNSDRVPDYLAAADLFVLPSVLEGMSNAILEAMASGLPVVANAVGGNPELVVDGITGLLCEQGDTDALSERIARLLLHDTLREEMGGASRRRAEEQFSIATMMRAYADYYRRVAPGAAEAARG